MIYRMHQVAKLQIGKVIHQTLFGGRGIYVRSYNYEKERIKVYIRSISKSILKINYSHMHKTFGYFLITTNLVSFPVAIS